MQRRIILALTTASAIALAGFGAVDCIQDSKRDAELNDEVASAVAADTAGLPVAVSTDERIVTLSGYVATDGERERIEAKARRVDGVLGVRNELRIVPDVRTTGGVLAKPDAGHAP